MVLRSHSSTYLIVHLCTRGGGFLSSCDGAVLRMQGDTLRTPRGGIVKVKDYLIAFARLEVSAGDRFWWCYGSGRLVKRDANCWPFVQNDSQGCPFCDLVVNVVRDSLVQPTYHDGFKLKTKNFYGNTWKGQPHLRMRVVSASSYQKCRR